MRRTFALVAAIGMTLLLVTGVLAANAHYVTGPSLTVSGNALTISGKAAGLGNIGSADATLTGTIDVNSRCFTKKGNAPQADNKQEAISVDQDQSFPVRHGSVTFSFSVSPLSTLRCPGNQYVGIESISYNLTLNWPDFPELNTTFNSN
jgi:hypothetical protein